MTEIDSMSDSLSHEHDPYDAERLARCRLVVIGVGWAAGVVEDLARAGIGSFVLVDPATVAASHLVTQPVSRKDFGRAKTGYLKERILDINPNAEVITREQPFDALDDATIAAIVTAPLGPYRPPIVTLICDFTGASATQARVNRLALHLGIPSLCAEIGDGRLATITFTYPGVTVACHHCMLHARRQAYLSLGAPDRATTDPPSIVAITRLNALCGFIALALFHHGMFPLAGHMWMRGEIFRPGYLRWGKLLRRVGQYPLVEVRMDPAAGSVVDWSVRDRAIGSGDLARILEVTWIRCLPDPACPDCGGAGDLRQSIGTFSDTQLPRRFTE